jgi:hypothetical protein
MQLLFLSCLVAKEFRIFHCVNKKIYLLCQKFNSNYDEASFIQEIVDAAKKGEEAANVTK